MKEQESMIVKHQQENYSFLCFLFFFTDISNIIKNEIKDYFYKNDYFYFYKICIILNNLTFTIMYLTLFTLKLSKLKKKLHKKTHKHICIVKVDNKALEAFYCTIIYKRKIISPLSHMD